MSAPDHHEGSSEELWQEFVAEFNSLNQLVGRLLSLPASDRLNLIKKRLTTSGLDRSVALRLIEELREEERLELFSDLIDQAKYEHGNIGTVRHIIASMPREWVMRRIMAEIEPHLKIAESQNDDEPFLRFTELLSELHRKTADEFAASLLTHSNPHVREAAAWHFEPGSTLD